MSYSKTINASGPSWGQCQLQNGTCRGCLSFTPQGLNHVLQQLSCWPSTLPEGVQGGGVGPGRTDLQIVRYSQKLILWAQSLYFLISRKELKSFMVATLSHDQQKLHETNRNFLQKNKHLIACIPVSSKSHIYHTSPYHFGANSQSYLRCCVPGYSPYFAPNKM